MSEAAWEFVGKFILGPIALLALGFMMLMFLAEILGVFRK